MARGRKTGGGSRKDRPNRRTAEIASIAAQYGVEAVAKLVTLMRSSPDEVVAMKAALELIDRGFGRAAIALPHALPPQSMANFGFDVSFEDGGPGEGAIETNAQTAAEIYQRVIRGELDAGEAAKATEAMLRAPHAAKLAPPMPCITPSAIAAPTPPNAAPPKPTPADKPRVVSVVAEDVLPRVLSSAESERVLNLSMSRTRQAEADAKADEQRERVERQNEIDREQAKERERKLAAVQW